MRIFSILLISTFALTGCAAAETEQSTSDESSMGSEQQSDQDSNNQDSAEPDIEDFPDSNDEGSSDSPDLSPDDLPDFDSSEYVTVDSIEDAAIIAANTFDKFDKDGIVETLRGEAGNVVLVNNPDQKDDYSAAWINTIDDTAELIFDARDFTSAWPFLLLSEPGNLENTYFGAQPGGFTLEYEDPSFGRYGFNYLTDGEELLGAWWYLEEGNPESAVVVTYNYEVDQKWIDRLDTEVEEFLAEQPAE